MVMVLIYGLFSLICLVALLVCLGHLLKAKK